MRVYICDRKHPHHGEVGELVDEIIRLPGSGKPMAKVVLDNCKHGTEACFVEKGQVRSVQD